MLNISFFSHLKTSKKLNSTWELTCSRIFNKVLFWAAAVEYMVLTSWPSNVNSGGSCSHPLKRSWPHLPHWSRPPMYTCMPNFVQIGLSCHPWVVKTPKFYRILNFCMLWRLVEPKTNVDAQLQTFPTNNIKTTSKSMSLTQTLSSKSVTDKYTKSQHF